MKKWMLCFSLIATPLFAAVESAPSPLIETLGDEAKIFVHEGDALFGVRTETQGGREAIASYEKAMQKNPALVEAYWKAARAAHWVGDHAPVKREKVVWLEKGIDYAKEAIRLEPKSVEAHFWLGANYGTYGEVKGVLKSLSLVKPIRTEMETVVRLDDKYQGGAGYRVLGILDYKVPGFAGGSKKRALENLKKAVEIDANNAFNQYYLAEYYDEAGERYQALDALAILEKCETSHDVDGPDLRMIQSKGKALRKKIGK